LGDNLSQSKYLIDTLTQKKLDPQTLPLVAILMGVYNGENFLAEQLDSISNQQHEHWVLYVSDDGSKDSTIQILEEYQYKWGKEKLRILKGPQEGFCKNFLAMACDQNIHADYYAFCDQDDVWFPNKLSTAIEIIANHQQEQLPFVYCGRTIYVDEKLQSFGMSRLFTSPKTFQNALVHSIAGGNTMVFNQTTKLLLEKVGTKKVASHDWWVYQIATGVGGELFFDPNPYIYYRQHSTTLVGQNYSIQAKLNRLKAVWEKKFKRLNDQNVNALATIKNLLSEDSRKNLEDFILIRNASFFQRLSLLPKCQLYRQTPWQTRVLKLAILLNLV
jgi:glycosyltransferase involved in cell wall biosynthesis